MTELGALDPQRLATLRAAGAIHPVAAGRRLPPAGRECLQVVLDGVVVIGRHTGLSAEPLDFALAGDFVSELLRWWPDATAALLPWAHGPVEVLAVRWPQYHRLAAADPAWIYPLARQLGERAANLPALKTLAAVERWLTRRAAKAAAARPAARAGGVVITCSVERLARALPCEAGVAERALARMQAAGRVRWRAPGRLEVGPALAQPPE